MRRRRRWRQTGSTSVFAAGSPSAQGEDATTAVERRLMPLAYIVDTPCTRFNSSEPSAIAKPLSRPLTYPTQNARSTIVLDIFCNTLNSFSSLLSRSTRQSPAPATEKFLIFVLRGWVGTTFTSKEGPESFDLQAILSLCSTKFFAEPTFLLLPGRPQLEDSSWAVFCGKQPR